MSLASKIISVGVAIAMAALIARATPHLTWDYIPLPEDVGKPVAFNVWESFDLVNWGWIGSVTNLSGTATNVSYPIEVTNSASFYRGSSVFIAQ